MNSHRHPPLTPPRRGTLFAARSPYRVAVERLDAALERNTVSNNSHKIRLLRMALFGDVDRVPPSGEGKIPD